MQTTESNKISIWRLEKDPSALVSKYTARFGWWLAQAFNLPILKHTAVEAPHQFCTVTAPRHWPLHIKARDTRLPLCAACMSPLWRGLGGQAAGAPSTERCEQQAWLLICCADNSHAHFDILRGQPLWLTLVEFTQHVRFLPISPVWLAWY